jgi:hypothetical protein
MNYIMTKHAMHVCVRLEISEELVYKILKIGREYPSKNHDGQMRHSACRYCVVTEGKKVITIYKDKVITPLRKEQVDAGVEIRRKA